MPGPLMLDLQGLSLSSEERELLSQPEVGGLILFTRNYSDKAQLQALIAEVRKASPDILIAVDHEGGRVQRFREGFTRIPPMAALGRLYQDAPEQALAAAEDIGWLMAAELRELDIDFSFAPVLDLDWLRSEVIGDRSFGAAPEQVAALAGAFAKGMREAGMPSTGKHFPGHGWVEADSHLAIPHDERPMAELEGDIAPFAALIQEGLEGIMPAHVIYDQLDEQPAGFSRFWLQEQLRQRLGFDGVIFSDDLSMEGAVVAGNYAQRAEAALSAGCDMLLACNNREGALAVLEYLQQNPQPENTRLAQVSGKAFTDSPQRREQALAWIQKLS